MSNFEEKTRQLQEEAAGMMCFVAVGSCSEKRDGKRRCCCNRLFHPPFHFQLRHCDVRRRVHQFLKHFSYLLLLKVTGYFRTFYPFLFWDPPTEKAFLCTIPFTGAVVCAESLQIDFFIAPCFLPLLLYSPSSLPGWSSCIVDRKKEGRKGEERIHKGEKRFSHVIAAATCMQSAAGREGGKGHKKVI